MHINKIYFLRVFIPLVYLLISTTDILCFWQKSGYTVSVVDYTKGTFATSAIGNFLICITLLFLLKNFDKTIKILLYNKLILLLLVYLLISCFWADNMLVSLRKCIKMIGLYLMLIFMQIDKHEYSRTLKSVLLYYFIITSIFSITLIVLFPQWGYMPYNDGVLPKGIFFHKNQMGAFAAFFFLWFILVGYKRNVYYLAICLALLISSKAFGATISLIGTLFITFSFFIVLKKNEYSLKGMLVFAILTLCIALYLLIALNNLDLITATLALFNKDQNMTGRADLWPLLISFGIKHHRLFGSGYESFFISSNITQINRVLQWDALNAHNGFLHIFLNSGIIGLSLMIMLMVSCLLKNIFDKNIPYTSFLILFVFCNLSEATFFRTYFPFFFFLITCYKNEIIPNSSK